MTSRASISHAGWTRACLGVAAGLLGLTARLLPAQAVWEDPPGTRAAAGTNGWIATIPFADDGDPWVFLAVRVNGAPPQWWVLDSGASVCLVDKAAARRLGLAVRGTRQIRGAGRGTVGIDSVRGRVRLGFGGGFTTACDHTAAADLSGLVTTMGRPVAGVLGYDFFARHVVEVDHVAHTVRLYDPAVYRYAGRGDTVPIALVHRLPRVTVHISDGGRPAVGRSLILDTGSGDAVDDSLVLHSTTLPRYTVGAGQGLGGGYAAIAGTFDTVRVGRFALSQVPAVAPSVGVVGNAVWRRFTLVVDYPGGRLFLEPNEQSGGAFDRGPRSGISLFAPSYRPEPTVSEVNTGSPAAAAGIRPGDVIYELDGRPIRQFGGARLARLLDRRGRVYRLGVRRRGHPVRVLLRL